MAKKHVKMLHLIRHQGKASGTRDLTTHLLEWPKSRAPTTPDAGEHAEQRGRSLLAGGGAERCGHLGGQFGDFLQSHTCSCRGTQPPPPSVFTPKSGKLVSTSRPGHGCNSFIQSHQNLEATETSSGRRTDTRTASVTQRNVTPRSAESSSRAKERRGRTSSAHRAVKAASPKAPHRVAPGLGHPGKGRAAATESGCGGCGGGRPSTA